MNILQQTARPACTFVRLTDGGSPAAATPTEFRKTTAAVWCSHLLAAQFIDSVLH